MGGAAQVINLAASFLGPALSANRLRSPRDFARLLRALSGILCLAFTSSTAILRENCVGSMRNMISKEDLLIV